MVQYTTRGLLKKAYPPRNAWNHKGQHGKLLVIAGSQQYTGSPVFNCMAALRAGADLVHLYSCRRAADIAANFSPDVITIPFEGTRISTWNVRQALTILPSYQGLVVGGGLGSHPDTLKAVRQILAGCSIPAVVDADALRAVAAHESCLKGGKFVLTPHADEFRALEGIAPSLGLQSRCGQVRKLAARIRQVVLLKGHLDVISDGTQVLLNRTGSPCMTKGGGGDCLAGICGALLARGLPTLEAAATAAFINGRAGSLACKEFGEGYIASDLLARIPEALKQ
jgi:hydroxyethylthiazole kinase-like uncharacterized protein yjeF